MVWLRACQVRCHVFVSIALVVAVVALWLLPVEAQTAPKVNIVVTSTPAECTKRTKVGDLISFHYRSTVVNKRGGPGTVVDDSWMRNEPLLLRLGQMQVIRGWDDGLTGMCVGERRTLTVPPILAYSRFSPSSKVPPESTMKYEVELVDIKYSSP